MLLIDTADKIMTGNSNGTVALYDLGKGGSKLERLKTHHQSGRAINVVSFAGPSGQGTLLASGCQDGDIKLSVSKPFMMCLIRMFSCKSSGRASRIFDYAGDASRPYTSTVFRASTQ